MLDYGFDELIRAIEGEYPHKPQTNPIIDLVNDKNCKLFLFGAGLGGRDLLNWVRKKHGIVHGFCDNHKSGYYLGLPILTFAELMGSYSKNQNVYIGISTGDKYYNEIQNQLKQGGFPEDKIIPRYYFEDKLSLADLKPHIDGFRWIYEHVEDDISKEIIVNLIKQRLVYFEMPHEPDYTRYFDKQLMHFGEQEVYVDGGVFNGDTILSFYEAVEGKYKSIWGFEPDRENFKSAQASLVGMKNLFIINKGLWSTNTTLSFHSGQGTMSCIGADGDTEVPVIGLDEFYAKQRDDLPSIIKMDIQGAELQAIIGAKNIIRNQHPKLIICAYHELSHIYELAQVIQKIDPAYKFWLRHYSYNAHETVLYAI